MIKIKLDRWKEVVRLECTDDSVFDILDLDYLCGFLDIDRESISKYIDLADIHKLRITVEKHNNSIKDDGYGWECGECDSRCKSIHKAAVQICEFVEGSYRIKANWKPINNNKIEIIEDKQDD